MESWRIQILTKLFGFQKSSWFIFSWLTTNFGAVTRRPPHSHDVNHWVFFISCPSEGQLKTCNEVRSLSPWGLNQGTFKFSYNPWTRHEASIMNCGNNFKYLARSSIRPTLERMTSMKSLSKASESSDNTPDIPDG